MTTHYSENDVIMIVARLTRPLLYRFMTDDLVRPQQLESVTVFTRIDIARLELLCDLTLDLGLDETALGVVISLIDQLHLARRDLMALADAIDALPDDLRSRIGPSLAKG